MRHLSVQVDGRDRRNHPTGTARNRPPAKPISVALRLQKFVELFRIHVVGALVDIDELRKRTGLRNGFGCGDEGVRHGEYTFALSDPGGNKREPQRVRPTADANTMAYVAEFRKGPLKIFDGLPSYE